MKNFLKRWPEFIGLPIAFAIYFLSPIVLRWYDPTTASFDPAILQAIAYAIVVVLVANVVVFIGIKVNFPSLYEFWQSCFLYEHKSKFKKGTPEAFAFNQTMSNYETETLTLTPIQKLCAFAFFFFCYFAAFLLALKTLL